MAWRCLTATFAAESEAGGWHSHGPFTAHPARHLDPARLPGKVLAVIGMRRSGKTSLLWQELGNRHHLAGLDRSALPWISLEDERLIGAGP